MRSSCRHEARAAASRERVGGQAVQITGFDALAEGTSGEAGPGLLIEVLIGAVGALVVLVVVFASFLAVVPPAIAAVSILTTFRVLLALAQLAEVSAVVQFLLPLIGLGLAIDYSLLVVIRWREERARGAEGDEAIERAMVTSGSAVVFSGTTVASAARARRRPGAVHPLDRVRRPAHPDHLHPGLHHAAAGHPAQPRRAPLLAPPTV